VKRLLEFPDILRIMNNVTEGAPMFASEGKETVLTSNAPKPIGPYSQAVRIDTMVFASGQAGLDADTGELVQGGVEAETRQTLTNIRNVLEASDSGMGYVVKTTVFLIDMNDFSKMNAIYAEFFPKDPPARSTVAVAALPRGARVEIEAIALLQSPHGD
jgi:2-iminobutanoate/2-iminopropanoate deaminase